MTDAKSWIEETRTLTATGKSQGEYTVAAVTSLRRLPRALDALNAVLELCDEWDREVSIPGVPGVECDESFKVRLVIQKAIEGAINE